LQKPFGFFHLRQSACSPSAKICWQFSFFRSDFFLLILLSYFIKFAKICGQYTVGETVSINSDKLLEDQHPQKNFMAYRAAAKIFVFKIPVTTFYFLFANCLKKV